MTATSLRWRFWRFLERMTDRACDLPDTRWETLDNLPFGLADALKRFVCTFAGHVPTGDQCGIPAHDYCVYCHVRTPGQAVRPGAPA